MNKKSLREKIYKVSAEMDYTLRFVTMYGRLFMETPIEDTLKTILEELQYEVLKKYYE